MVESLRIGASYEKREGKSAIVPNFSNVRYQPLSFKCQNEQRLKRLIDIITYFAVKQRPLKKVQVDYFLAKENEMNHNLAQNAFIKKEDGALLEKLLSLAP